MFENPIFCDLAESRVSGYALDEKGEYQICNHGNRCKHRYDSPNDFNCFLFSEHQRKV